MSTDYVLLVIGKTKEAELPKPQNLKEQAALELARITHHEDRTVLDAVVEGNTLLGAALAYVARTFAEDTLIVVVPDYESRPWAYLVDGEGNLVPTTPGFQDPKGRFFPWPAEL
ncbi:MAG: hypothetical protein ABDH20_05580 [Thermus sp.]